MLWKWVPVILWLCCTIKRYCSGLLWNGSKLYIQFTLRIISKEIAFILISDNSGV